MTLEELKGRFSDPTPAELQLIADYAALPEDARRARAFEAFAGTGLPHRRLEAWKWTDFRQALPTIEPGARSPSTPVTPPEDASVFRFDGQAWHVPETLPEGLRVIEAHEGQAYGNAEALPLGALAAALSGKAQKTNALQIEVTGRVETPVFLDYSAAGRETAFSRISFVVREDAGLDVIESHSGGAGFSASVIEFSLGKSARVSRTLAQTATRDEATGITANVHLDERASYTQTALAMGAKVARIETRLTYGGEEAQATMNAAYLASDGYHVDFTSHVRHDAQSCVTRQLTKGAVSDGGRGVFQGKFMVPRVSGQYTDADMQHQALLLEDGAEIFAKPELEIYADDVECAHGNTSGQLDESALFYMRQRGLPYEEARALLTEAFIAEALETSHAYVREAFKDLSRQFLRKQGQD